jgi:hypothetical protein
VRIEIGQDALRRWAWMIFDEAGACVASDDDYGEAALAMEDALSHVELREKSERRKAEAAG